jgi:CRP-like cAMP-binding protein
MHEMLRKYLNDMTSSTVSDEEFKYVEEAFVTKSMKKRQYLLHEGSVCKYIAFIVKGAMRLYSIDDKGTEHIVRFGVEGWWMSDRESFMMLTPSKFNIDALEDCQLLLTTGQSAGTLPLIF